MSWSPSLPRSSIPQLCGKLGGRCSVCAGSHPFLEQPSGHQCKNWVSNVLSELLSETTWENMQEIIVGGKMDLGSARTSSQAVRAVLGDALCPQQSQGARFNSGGPSGWSGDHFSIRQSLCWMETCCLDHVQSPWPGAGAKEDTVSSPRGMESFGN